jgi:hypothetical protein
MHTRVYEGRRNEFKKFPVKFNIKKAYLPNMALIGEAAATINQ